MLASPWALALANENSKWSAVVLGSMVLALGTGALAADLRRRVRAAGRPAG